MKHSLDGGGPSKGAWLSHACVAAIPGGIARQTRLGLPDDSEITVHTASTRVVPCATVVVKRAGGRSKPLSQDSRSPLVDCPDADASVAD
jgi:hypothetical protein